MSIWLNSRAGVRQILLYEINYWNRKEQNLKELQRDRLKVKR